MGVAHQTGSSNSIEFELLQPTSPLPQALQINFCNGEFGVNITAADGRSITLQQLMWNMSACDFENGQANVSLNIDDVFHAFAAADENYTVVFNILLQVDGIVDPCFLYLEVDNVTVSQLQGEQIVPNKPYLYDHQSVFVAIYFDN